MKLRLIEQSLNEQLQSWDQENIDKARAFVQEHCQPFIQAAKGNILYRGTHPLTYDPVFIKSVRQDRKPSASAPWLHNTFNRFIEAEGLVANRSNSIFCSGDWGQASFYGTPFAILPIGKFNYTWTPDSRDWFSSFAWAVSLSNNLISMFRENAMRLDGIESLPEVITYLESTIHNVLPGRNFQQIVSTTKDKTLDSIRRMSDSDFKTWVAGIIDIMVAQKLGDFTLEGDNNSLDRAIKSHNEVMVHCKQAVYANSEIYQYLIGGK